MSRFSPVFHAGFRLHLSIAFLFMAIFLGGASRADVLPLLWLRPIAILVLCYAALTISREAIDRYRFLVGILAAATILTILHLIPLPPTVWQSLPGRQIFSEIGEVLDYRDAWRSLSMVPAGTLNALYALSVPWALLLLLAPLNRDEMVKVLACVAVALLVGAVIGFGQAAGFGGAMYNISNPNAGFFANRNHQAVALSCLFPILAALTVVVDVKQVPMSVRYALVGAAYFALLLLLMVTGSRAGLVSALLAIASVPFVVGKGARAKGQVTRRFLLPTIAGAAAILALATWSVTISDRNLLFLRLVQLDAADDLRFPVWGATWALVEKYMPLGSGVGSFVEVFQIDEPDSLIGPQYWNHAHNDWLEVAMTAGVPGIALLAIATLGFVLAAIRAAEQWRSRRRVHVLAKLGCVIVILLGLASVVDYPLRTPAAMALMVVAAMLASQRDPRHAIS